MSDVPYGARSGSQRTWAPGETDDSAWQGDAGQADAGQDRAGVKERAAETASQIGDAGRDAAHDAKERARDVANEATDQVRGLADRARTELSSQAGTQQQKLAGGIRSLGDELSQMAGGTQEPGYASEIVDRAGDATKQVAQWFEDREPGAVLHEVESFARRRPGLFLVMAAGAGLLVGRFLRSAKDAPSDGPDRSVSTGDTDAGGPSGPVGGSVDGSGDYPPPVTPTPPTFAPTMAGSTRPQTFGGESDVRHA